MPMFSPRQLLLAIVASFFLAHFVSIWLNRNLSNEALPVKRALSEAKHQSVPVIHPVGQKSPLVLHERKNVLMIIIDDLRPQLGIYHDNNLKKEVFPHMYTPNIDSLASHSLLIQNAYAQYAVCGPSRASALTSRRPSTTKVYDLSSYWRKTGGNFSTLPQYFKQHGYYTQGIGKIFHHGSASGNNNDVISWTHKFVQPKGPSLIRRNSRSWYAVPQKIRRKYPLIDDTVMSEARKSLAALFKESKRDNTHFFLAVGFYKPHLPWIFPEEFLGYYPLAKMDLPENKYSPINMPRIASSHYHELQKYRDIKVLNKSGEQDDIFEDRESKELRRAYYAAVSFIDYQLGELVHTLKMLGLYNDTIIALWGDHGFLLGEHGTWCKHSLFEMSSRIPMFVRVPGLTDHGPVTEHLIELVDLFPTLVDLAGLPMVSPCPKDSRHIEVCTEGSSFSHLLSKPEDKNWKTRIFSEQARELVDSTDVLGHSIRTRSFRYTEWPLQTNGTVQWDKLYGKELYNLKNDPLQTVNLAGKAGYRNIQEALRDQLRAGWKDAQISSNHFV